MAQRPEGTVALEAVLFTLTTPAKTALEISISTRKQRLDKSCYKPEAYDESRGKNKGCQVWQTYTLIRIGNNIL